MSRMRKRALLLDVAAGVLFLAADTSAREGFSISIAVVAKRETDREHATTLKRYAEEAILAGGGTLAPDKGDLNVTISIDPLDSRGNFTGSYEIADKMGKVLDSGTLSLGSARQAGTEVASRLVPTRNGTTRTSFPSRSWRARRRSANSSAFVGNP